MVVISKEVFLGSPAKPCHICGYKLTVSSKVSL